MGNELKAVGGDEKRLIVRNHIVLFDGRDLEGFVNGNLNPDGSKGEYFSKSVALESPYTDIGYLYMGWEHGWGDLGEPGPHDVLGYVDWSTAKRDEVGVVVDRILNRRNRYVREIVEPLVQAGLVGTSSEAISAGVEKAADGAILRWPLSGDTITVTPMEPRMLGENRLKPVKAILAKYPQLKSALLGHPDKAALFNVDKAKNSGVMVALYPPEDVARAIALEEGVAPEDLHITLGYYGDARDLSSVQIASIISQVESLASQNEPVQARLAGVGRFAATQSSDNLDAVHLSVDSLALDSIRFQLDNWAARVSPMRTHSFSPHMTLSYIKPSAEMPITSWRSRDVTFDAISLVVGDNREDFPFYTNDMLVLPDGSTRSLNDTYDTPSEPKADRPKGASAAPGTADRERALQELTLELELLGATL